MKFPADKTINFFFIESTILYFTPNNWQFVGGILFISLFGWITFNGLRDATNSLEKEAKSTGSSSEEFSVVSSFLASTREVFTIMETYPQNYPGVFNVAYDSITLSKESINILSDKYFTNYTDEILSPFKTN